MFGLDIKKTGSTLAALVTFVPISAAQNLDRQNQYGESTLPNLSSSLGLSKDVIFIKSDEDFWNKFTPENSLYIDNPDVATPEQLNKLSAWLKTGDQKHHWSVILLKDLDAGALTNQIAGNWENHPQISSLHADDSNERDGSMIIIGRKNTWTINDPHFQIRVRSGAYFDARESGASSKFFDTKVLPDMKLTVNSSGPAEAAMDAITKLEQGASDFDQNAKDQVFRTWLGIAIFGSIIIYAATRPKSKSSNRRSYGSTSTTSYFDSGGSITSGGSDSDGSWGGGDS